MGESARLAFKAYEIEELVDIYFFRRLGYLVARAAGALRLTPNDVSVLAALAGLAGGALLYDPARAVAGFALLVVHGIFDSADGQLARLSGQTSEIGRVLDGIAGYVTHAAIYLAIGLGGVTSGRGWSLFGWALVAAGCTAVHAQLYDYHRTTYAEMVGKGRAAPPITNPSRLGDASGPLPTMARVYEVVQRRLAGLHPEVERALAARAGSRPLNDAERASYRSAFYRLVRGWNLLGDNVRRFAIGTLAFVQQVDWFVAFVLVPMNVVLAVLWLVQRRADRRFLEALGAADAVAAAGPAARHAGHERRR
jgi:phosphatidylglycerophosphate synthase